MNASISFQYPYWFLLFCIALGAIYAAALYYQDKSFDEKTSGSIWLKVGMATVRFLATTFLAILLISPFLKIRQTETVKPLVAIIHDNSESVKNGLGADTTLYTETMTELKSALSKKYEVAEFSASDELMQGMDYSFTGKSTNLSGAIDGINDIFYNRNLGAVVLASDGIYNKGINPVYTASKANYSIYTIALGDTAIQRDQKIANAFFNKVVYLNDNFSIKADIAADNLQGRNVKLSIYEIDGATKLLQQKEINYNSSNYFKSVDFIVPANKSGIAHYRLVLSNTDGEISYRNNSRDVFIEVLDGRQKILLVAQSPHPDVAALRSAIENNKNYQVEVDYATDPTKKIIDYNLLILHQFPSVDQRIQNILREAREQKKSILFVIGSQTSIPDLLKTQNTLSFRGNTDKFNEVSASVNKNFSLFSLSDKTTETIRKLPPMSNFFGEYVVNPAAKVLLFQKINSVQTDFPLWILDESSESKTGIICGEGIWKWRLHDFLMNKNQEATNELINKTIQFLAVKTDKRPFRVSTSKTIFSDNEAVMFDAQLYNANYELINQSDVEIQISGSEGQNFKYKFGKTESAYTLNAGFLPPGNYTYSAQARLGNANLQASGKFSVSPLQFEETRTRADHQVLFQLANQHNGTMHRLKDAMQIAKEIDEKNSLKPILYDSYQTENAINMKWIFFILLILVSAEWGVRKYLGGY